MGTVPVPSEPPNPGRGLGAIGSLLAHSGFRGILTRIFHNCVPLPAAPLGSPPSLPWQGSQGAQSLDWAFHVQQGRVGHSALPTLPETSAARPPCQPMALVFALLTRLTNCFQEARGDALMVQTRRLCLCRGFCPEVLCASTWWELPGISPLCHGVGKDRHRLQTIVVIQRLCLNPSREGVKAQLA